MISPIAIATRGRISLVKRTITIATVGLIVLSSITPPTNGGGGGDGYYVRKHNAIEREYKNLEKTNKMSILLKEDTELIEILQTSLKYIL